MSFIEKANLISFIISIGCVVFGICYFFYIMHYNIRYLIREHDQHKKEHDELKQWITSSPLDPHHWGSLEEKIVRLIDIKRPLKQEGKKGS